jgi:glycosyltransferase involved in cell wall biosynthesis
MARAYSMSPHMTRVWINVTTSVNWNRPAVGIVRVERALVEHLQKLFGTDRCKLCVWRDDRFVEWLPESTEISPRVTQAVDTIVPQGPSFDIVRPFVLRAFDRFSRNGRSDGKRAHEFRVDLPLSGVAPLHPAPGDFLVSVGLDWDHPYTRQFYKLRKKQGLRIITCCYDLIPVLFPQYCVGEVAKSFTEYFLDLSWGSEAVLCISEQTRRDYAQLCKELGAPLRRTVVIPLGDNLPSGNAEIGQHVRSVTAAPFILFVSTIERRKNHEVLYRAYHILARRGQSKALPRIIFVGMPGWGVGELLKDIELDPLTKDMIVQLNHVSDSELEYLYRHALFCVFPSLYEGWGLPVGEALAMGKAVIASGEASLPEVGGELVHYLPAWNPYAWADTIQEYVENPQLIRDSEQRVRAHYTPRDWSDTARTVQELIFDLSGTGNETSFELLPGYDLSTLCGMHVGPSIRTTGSAGLLLFGPHRALRKGGYRVHMQGHLIKGHRGAMTVQVASSSGNFVHFSKSYSLSRDDTRSEFAIDLSFSLDQDVRDFEIKTIISESSAIQFDRITVSSALQPAIAAGGENNTDAPLVVDPASSQPATR